MFVVDKLYSMLQAFNNEKSYNNHIRIVLSNLYLAAKYTASGDSG